MITKTTAAYKDCFSIMEQALKAEGARVIFPTKAKATVFRHRCYKGRSLLYRNSVATVPAGTMPFTQFDDIVIRFESDVKPDGSDCVLLFLLRSKQDAPAITDLNGNPIDETPSFFELKIEGITLDE